jgi:hypothetical protein
VNRKAVQLSGALADPFQTKAAARYSSQEKRSNEHA